MRDMGPFGCFLVHENPHHATAWTLNNGFLAMNVLVFALLFACGTVTKCVSEFCRKNVMCGFGWFAIACNTAWA